MNIYISNLSYDTTKDSLEELFEEYGIVTFAKVVTDRETGRPRGFGFVEMPDDAAGQQAIEDLNETSFEGKTIRVSVAKPRQERSNDNGYGGNRGGNGGSGERFRRY
jgi:RNA recognition motif-containing protein